MNSSNEVVEILSKCMIEAAKMIAKNSSFDKTSIGIVKEKNGNIYTVQAFGGKYEIYSSKSFTINQRVAVTALQNNFNNLIIREI